MNTVRRLRRSVGLALCPTSSRSHAATLSGALDVSVVRRVVLGGFVAAQAGQLGQHQVRGFFFVETFLQEVGGTSVLYIAAVPFDKIGLKTEVPLEPLPALTWRALSVVPDVAMVGSTLLGGVYWITHRRQKVAAEEAAEREAAQGGR